MQVFDLALLILRLAVGLTFAAHGAQKAFGWWDGPGPATWLRRIHGMGFHPPALFAAASIGAELVAGLALAIGFMTPLAACVLVAQAIVIAIQVHLPKGFFSTKGGIEFPLLLGTAGMAVGLLGPGSVSLDGLLGYAFEAQLRVALAIAGLIAGCIALAIGKLPRTISRPLGRAR